MGNKRPPNFRTTPPPAAHGKHQQQIPPRPMKQQNQRTIHDHNGRFRRCPSSTLKPMKTAHTNTIRQNSFFTFAFRVAATPPAGDRNSPLNAQRAATKHNQARNLSEFLKRALYFYKLVFLSHPPRHQIICPPSKHLSYFKVGSPWLQ